jgi:NAD(P)-dependent dehydrogenase (short-subunit alcohol dehydrogenase family)
MNVVITGTSSGLGQQLRTVFKYHGHDVIGSSHDTTQLQQSQLFLDLRRNTHIAQFAVNVMARFDRVDILINNAGINGIRPFEELDEVFIHELMQVNCIGPVLLTHHLLPILAHGRVINIISDAAYRPMRHSLAYNCSKAAFDMATKQMARELSKPYKLSIIGIRPGRMRNTHMSTYIDDQVMKLRDWTKLECQEYFEANSVTGCEQSPPHVARLIYQIATSDLSMFMSGACLDLVG